MKLGCYRGDCPRFGEFHNSGTVGCIVQWVIGPSGGEVLEERVKPDAVQARDLHEQEISDAVCDLLSGRTDEVADD